MQTYELIATNNGVNNREGAVYFNPFTGCITGQFRVNFSSSSGYINLAFSKDLTDKFFSIRPELLNSFNDKQHIIRAYIYKVPKSSRVTSSDFTEHTSSYTFCTVRALSISLVNDTLAINSNFNTIGDYKENASSSYDYLFIFNAIL